MYSNFIICVLDSLIKWQCCKAIVVCSAYECLYVYIVCNVWVCECGQRVLRPPPQSNVLDNRSFHKITNQIGPPKKSRKIYKKLEFVITFVDSTDGDFSLSDCARCGKFRCNLNSEIHSQKFRVWIIIVAIDGFAKQKNGARSTDDYITPLTKKSETKNWSVNNTWRCGAMSMSLIRIMLAGYIEIHDYQETHIIVIVSLRTLRYLMLLAAFRTNYHAVPISIFPVQPFIVHCTTVGSR